MAMASETGLRFVPSAVEGIESVVEAAVFPDRLELIRDGGEVVVVRFLEIARWPRFGRLNRWMARGGRRARGWPTVADRDWFHPPEGRYFRFDTTPPIVVFMPDEPAETDYGRSMFRRVQDVMALGGFGSRDLG